MEAAEGFFWCMWAVFFLFWTFFFQILFWFGQLLNFEMNEYKTIIWFDWFLWHINHCRLFNTKSFLYCHMVDHWGERDKECPLPLCVWVSRPPKEWPLRQDNNIGQFFTACNECGSEWKLVDVYTQWPGKGRKKAKWLARALKLKWQLLPDSGNREKEN